MAFLFIKNYKNTITTSQKNYFSSIINIGVNMKEVKEFDNNGNLIYHKDSGGFESRYKYDLNGNEIYYKDSTGYEEWFGYDSNGNEIHYKNLNLEE
jgi:hypothetical protein